MKKFIVNKEKDDNKYQVHELGSKLRPKSDFFYIEAQNIESAAKKATKETGKNYVPSKEKI